MAQMTRMQQKIYDYIAQMLAQEGYPPSVREIGAAVGLKSPSTVHFHLKHMEEKGIIKKAGRKGRTITLVQPPGAAGDCRAADAGGGTAGRPCAHCGNSGGRYADSGAGVYRGLSGL